MGPGYPTKRITFIATSPPGPPSLHANMPLVGSNPLARWRDVPYAECCSPEGTTRYVLDLPLPHLGPGRYAYSFTIFWTGEEGVKNWTTGDTGDGRIEIVVVTREVDFDRSLTEILNEQQRERQPRRARLSDECVLSELKIGGIAHKLPPQAQLQPLDPPPAHAMELPTRGGGTAAARRLEIGRASCRERVS